MFCPLTTTGAGELVVQTADGPRLVVDCSVKPVALVGHVKITPGPERIIVSCGVLTDPKERLKTVPFPELPPPDAVPYRVLLDKIKPP